MLVFTESTNTGRRFIPCTQVIEAGGREISRKYFIRDTLTEQDLPKLYQSFQSANDKCTELNSTIN